MAPTGSIGSSGGREEGFYSGSYGYSDIPEPIATPVPDFMQLRSYEEATDIAPAMVPAVPCPAPLYKSSEFSFTDESENSSLDFNPARYAVRKLYGLGEILENWGLGAEPGRPKEVAGRDTSGDDDGSSFNLENVILGLATSSKDGHVAADIEKARRVIKNNLEGMPPERLTSLLSGRGIISKSLDFLGKAVNAATGAANVIVEFKRDIDRGDTRLINTAKEIGISAAQVGTSAVSGTAAAVATSALFTTAAGLTAPMWVPVTVGVAVAAGTGWLASLGFDYIRREWKD